MVASPPIAMANIGMADTIILMILALVVFGPRRLPQIGRQIGKLMYEFRKASNDFKFQMEEELRQAEEADRRKKEEERQKALAAAQAGKPTESSANSAPSSSEASAAPASSSLANSDPGKSSHPGAAAGMTQPVTSTASTAEAARLYTEPRIQPPSSGEVVATNRPGMASNQPEASAQAAEDEMSTNRIATDPAANENASGANNAERSEPAPHNG